MPGPHFPVLSDPLDREWRSCIFACLMTACLYTIIGMVSGEKVGTCGGYLAYPFLENDQFFERMCQVASTGIEPPHSSITREDLAEDQLGTDRYMITPGGAQWRSGWRRLWRRRQSCHRSRSGGY